MGGRTDRKGGWRRALLPLLLCALCQPGLAREPEPRPGKRGAEREMRHDERWTQEELARLEALHRERMRALREDMQRLRPLPPELEREARERREWREGREWKEARLRQLQAERMGPPRPAHLPPPAHEAGGLPRLSPEERRALRRELRELREQREGERERR